MKEFVRVLCDVYCEWETIPPIYRVYVNEELFVERKWIWRDRYLEDLLQVEAESGYYLIRYELVNQSSGKLTVRNIRVEHGNAEIYKHHTLRIL